MPKQSGKRKSRTENLIARELQFWDLADLQELIEVAQGLVEAKTIAPEPKPEENPKNPYGYDGLYPAGSRGGRGYVESKMIPDSKTGKVYGPYLYLRYWGTGKDGKSTLKSMYLGKPSTSGS